MAQNKNAAKVQQNLHISKFYADILRDFCERKLRLVVLPVSACPYVLRSVHIYKRLWRNTFVLQQRKARAYLYLRARIA